MPRANNRVVLFQINPRFELFEHIQFSDIFVYAHISFSVHLTLNEAHSDEYNTEERILL